MTRHSISIVGGIIATGAGVGVWSTAAASIPANKTIVEISVGYQIAGAVGAAGGQFSVGLWTGVGLFLAQYSMPSITYNVAAAPNYIHNPGYQYPPRSYRMGDIPGGFYIVAGPGASFLAARLDNAAAQAAAPTIYMDVWYQD